MAIQYINTGSSANAGNGDSLRSAFTKVNNNFAYLSTASFGGNGGNGYTGSQGDIGYTGSAGDQGIQGYTGSAGISSVFISTSTTTGALAYYVNSTTITSLPRINFRQGVLNIGDGSTGTFNSLYIENSVATENFGRGFTYANHINISEGNNFTFYRSRGTPTAPTATIVGDEIVDIAFLGHSGTIPTYGASITAVVDQVPVGGQVPTRLVFAGNNNAGQVQTHMAITSTGTIRMNSLGALAPSTQISVSASLIPKYDVTYDLGSTSSQWRSLYVSSSTIYIDNKAFSIDAGNNITVDGQITNGGSTRYTPADSNHWQGEPTVNTVAAALDELAARLTAVQNSEIDGGNAYTPPQGELIIDGNGA